MRHHKVFIFFLLFWLIQSLIAAVSTELYFDEAYYWMYAQFLDWGYFDHPPAVAVMIWLGSFLGKNELSVRIVNVLLMTASLAIIYRAVKPSNPLIFCLTLFSFLIFHLSGFVALPDTPFLFFALLFMLAYKNFLASPSRWCWAQLGVAAALMLYSKYHGALVIVCVIGSNVRLLTNYRFYLAGATALILFSPHLWWQIHHDFPSLQYHLIDRAKPYQINQTLEYLFGNIPFQGGLVSVALLIASFRYRATNRWEKALQWNLYGTLLFFFLVTFKGQFIEPNWTIFCAFPLLYLGYRGVETARWFGSYQVLACVFAAILLLLKIHLIYPLVYIKKDRVWDFHQNRRFVREVQALAEGNLMVANDYKIASLLNFYAEVPYRIPSLNINKRANQYSIWPFDTLLCHQNVLFINQHLPGTLIERPLHKPETATELHSVTSPNLFELSEGTAVREKATITLSLVVASPPCEYEDQLSLEIVMQGDGTDQVIRKELPESMDRPKERLTYRISPPQTKDINAILVRVISNKLGGGTHQRLAIKVDAL